MLLKLTVLYMVGKLNEHIIGQENQKEIIVSTILDNIDSFFANKIKGKRSTKKNILLYGPTGSGKTEISRTLASIIGIPFCKVNITDYTLTGYHGRDPQEIVNEFYSEYLRNMKEYEKFLKNYCSAYFSLLHIKEKGLKESLFKPIWELAGLSVFFFEEEAYSIIVNKYDSRSIKRKASEYLKLRYEVYGQIISRIIRELSSGKKIMESAKIGQRIKSVLSSKFLGIIFIDEFDKILIKESQYQFYTHLQKQLLHIVEGAKFNVSTGESLPAEINTENITFILSGSFFESSPEELIPELKGRLSVRVKLEELSREELKEIAKRNFSNFFSEIEEFYSGLIKVEESFWDRIADIAVEENKKEYLGARRLQHILSKIEQHLHKELNVSSLPIYLNSSFVEWCYYCNDLKSKAFDFEKDIKKVSRKKQNNFTLSDKDYKILYEIVCEERKIKFPEFVEIIAEFELLDEKILKRFLPEIEKTWKSLNEEERKIFEESIKKNKLLRNVFKALKKEMHERKRNFKKNFPLTANDNYFDDDYDETFDF